MKWTDEMGNNFVNEIYIREIQNLRIFPYRDAFVCHYKEQRLGSPWEVREEFREEVTHELSLIDTE